jgi:3',5'-cyclic AMP phosphodiesterase CpdA
VALSRRVGLVLLGIASALGAPCGDDDGLTGGESPPPATGGLGGSGFGGARDGSGSPWAGREVGPEPMPGGDAAAGTDAAPDPSQFNCPEVPTAWVFDFVDPHTGTQGQARELLAAAGFDVQTLPLDRNPTELQGLMFLGSFASESPAYREWVDKNARAIYTFVDAANVLVQMTQADQTEAVPMFLPNSQVAQRNDGDVGALLALEKDNPLLAGIPLEADGTLKWKFPMLGWETFVSQRGFGVLLAGNASGQNAALMEGAYAQGRFILSAIPADKPVGMGPDRDAFNQAFFKNLYEYVRGVCRRQARMVEVTPPLGRPDLSDDSFMLAVLPDTQYYSLAWPGIYTAQTSWIAANAHRRRIAYVFHLGDIVDQNTPLEWERAADAMWLLEGIVPYALVTGNHDVGPSGNAANRYTLLNQYFSYDRTASWPTFGGAFQAGELENTYHLFSAGGRNYIVMALEWGPREEVVTWADGVMARYPDRYGILITHAYLNNNDWRYDNKDMVRSQSFNPHHYGTAGGVNDGEELWQKLVRKHAFVMTFNGHVLGDGTGYLASVTDRGTTCHQMLSNYQFRNLGGEGYMRLLEFLGDGKTVKVYTYSPLYDAYMAEPDQNLTFTLDVPQGPAPTGARMVAGTPSLRSRSAP